MSELTVERRKPVVEKQFRSFRLLRQAGKKEKEPRAVCVLRLLLVSQLPAVGAALSSHLLIVV